jgi:peptide deformylase
MILPIYAYGQPVLKKVAQPIDKHYENLPSLITNMWETMYNARGVGLAAPQIGLSIRLFIVDTIQLEAEEEEEDVEKGLKKVFINAEIVDEDGEHWAYEEGCLSIPHIRGDVERQDKIKIKYLDEHFKEHVEVFEGINARVIQHEYDHIEGILFTELLNPMRRRRIMRKLDNIKKGNVETEYRLKFK